MNFPIATSSLSPQNHETIARQQAAAVDAKGSVTKSEFTQELPATIKKLFENPASETIKGTGEETALPPGWVRGGGALGQLVREFDWSEDSARCHRRMAPKLENRCSHPADVALCHVDELGTGTHLSLQRRLRADDSREETPVGAGKAVSARYGRKSGTTLVPAFTESWRPARRHGMKRCFCSWSGADIARKLITLFLTVPCLETTAQVAGHLCVVTEETDRVIGERRLKTLRSLAGELNKTITEEEVVSCIARCLGENQKDLPFTLLYLFTEDGNEARLACQTGMAEDHPAAPESIQLTEKNQPWPISDLLTGKDSIVVENLPERFESVPSGSWDKSPWRALLLPITSQGQDKPAGVIVAALNPFRPLDVSYAGFINLVAGQIAASIANARAYSAEKKRAEALAEIDRAKTAFFSNVSHEFRTPLTLMLGPLEDLLARSQTHLSPTAKEQLDLVSRNGARLLRLVNTLLDFSRLEAGRVQAVYLATDLASFTSELASVFRSATDKAGLRLVVDCPDLGEPVYVDRDMWEKIVLNLISNAFKFTFEGEIAVSVHRVGSTAELRVRDTGVGIPAEAIPKLFERFNRVPNMPQSNPRRKRDRFGFSP